MKQLNWRRDKMKKSLMKVLTVGLCLTIAVAFTACGSKKSADKSGAKKDSGKTYTVAMEPTFPPFNTTNKDGDLDGFDVDMLKAIAKDQGFKVEFKNMAFASLVPALKAGSADIVASGMSITDDRKKSVDFSDPYYESGLIVMVKKSNNTVKGESSLTKDMKVASQTGTTGADEATKLEKAGKIKKAVILDGFDTCVQQLKNGDVAAVIIDKPVGENYMAKQKGQFKAVGKTMSAENFGIAVKKGNKELLKQLNDGLKDIVKSGEFKKICDKWNVASIY